MGIPQLRDELKDFISRADERFLKMVYAMALTWSNKEIVAHSADGTPLTAETYNAELKQAEEDIAEGRTTGTDEVKKQAEAWAAKYQK